MTRLRLTFVGYDTGYISSVLVTIGTSLGHELSTSEQELVTSITSGGALVGAVFAGLVADKYGRKMPSMYSTRIPTYRPDLTYR